LCGFFWLPERLYVNFDRAISMFVFFHFDPGKFAESLQSEGLAFCQEFVRESHKKMRLAPRALAVYTRKRARRSGFLAPIAYIYGGRQARPILTVERCSPSSTGQLSTREPPFLMTQVPDVRKKPNTGFGIDFSLLICGHVVA
jgi:hypothetical protein